MGQPVFIPLAIRSSYSLLEGALMVGTLAKMVAADGQPALALRLTSAALAIEPKHPAALAARRQALERLLAMEDHDLWALVSGREVTDDPQQATMIQRLREVSPIANFE